MTIVHSRSSQPALAPGSDRSALTANAVTQVTSRYPPELGGMERVVRELSEALAHELDGQVEIVTGARHKPRGTTVEGPLVVRRLRSFNAMVTPVIPGLVWALIRRRRPRLLHVHVAHAGTPEAVALVAALRRIPFVAHVHIDAAPTTWMGFLLAGYQRFLLARVLSRAAMVLVPTASYRDLLLNRYPLDPERVRVLSNGTSMEVRKGRPAARSGSNRPIRLVTVGRVANEKNLPLLIDAVDLLVNEEHLDVDLEVVGEGPIFEAIVQYVADRGLQSRIHLVGRRSGADLVDTYDRADLFVMTSLSESFGTVLVEAMARGVPVIAPDIAGVRDVVVDGVTGLLVDHCVGSLCSAILRMLSEPGLRERLVAGARAQSHRYEWPEIARQCIGLYNEVLGETPSREVTP